MNEQTITQDRLAKEIDALLVPYRQSGLYNFETRCRY